MTIRDSNSGLTIDATGKYHWYYEINMFTNPTIFITCWKVFTLSVGIVALILFFILLGDGFQETVIFLFQFILYGVGGMTVLLMLGYSVYAAIQGGKYCVIFEMDDAGVNHIQLAKQFKKAQVIAGLAILTGVVTGTHSMIGTGLLTGSRNSMETKFKSVYKIKVKRFRRVIYLNSAAGSNQIYASRENFGEVLNYILARIPMEAKRKGV